MSTSMLYSVYSTCMFIILSSVMHESVSPPYFSAPQQTHSTRLWAPPVLILPSAHTGGSYDFMLKSNHKNKTKTKSEARVKHWWEERGLMLPKKTVVLRLYAEKWKGNEWRLMMLFDSEYCSRSMSCLPVHSINASFSAPVLCFEVEDVNLPQFVVPGSLFVPLFFKN